MKSFNKPSIKIIKLVPEDVIYASVGCFPFACASGFDCPECPPPEGCPDQYCALVTCSTYEY